MSAASHLARRIVILVAAIALGALVAGVAAAASPNSWIHVAPLKTARMSHVAAPLPGNRVLIAGGEGASNNVLQSAAVFDAGAGTWTDVPDMGTPRRQAAAVVLADGRVLVAGGASSEVSSDALDTGEVYDPAANTWTPVTGHMGSAHAGLPTATLLPGGKVLIAGGADTTGSATAGADIYDPVQNAFTATNPMGTARAGATATALPGGKVLVAGGATNGLNPGDLVASATGEVYDPTSHTWTPVANAMTEAHAFGSAIALPSGKVLISGGESSIGTVTTASSDLYDPATNRFVGGPPMNSSRTRYAAASLDAGTGLVAGGVTVAQSTETMNVKAEVFSPSTNAWVPVAPMLLAKALAVATPLANGRVLETGGSNDLAFPVSDAELFTPPVLPGAPTSTSATAGNGTATVVFSPPASDGGLPILHYTVSASTGQNVTTPDARTVATVDGLANGKAVSFTVTASTALGTGPASAASALVTPTASPGPVSAPKLKLTGLKTKLKLAAFVKGVTFTLTPDRAASLQVSLLGGVNRATIARDFPLVLATKRFGMSARQRTVTITPAKRLVGKPRKATVQLVIVATGSSGLQSTTAKLLTITR